MVRTERMSSAFIKYHLDDGRAMHRFVAPEPRAKPPDHLRLSLPLGESWTLVQAGPHERETLFGRFGETV